jgi:hypothetical protein
MHLGYCCSTWTQQDCTQLLHTVFLLLLVLLLLLLLLL